MLYSLLAQSLLQTKMKHISNIFISVLLIASSYVASAQYAGEYYGVPITSEAVPIVEAWVENAGINVTTAPTCVTNAMSWDEPGQVVALEGYSYFGGNELVLSNSQHLSLVIGNEYGDIDGPTTVVPYNGTYDKGINVDRLWIGRKTTFNSPANGWARIDTQYDTLIVDEVWVPDGAVLEIVGQYPLIVRKELHNKGRIIANENLLLPVYTDGDITPKGFHAMFEQKGEMLGRYSYEIMLNERPEFLNWDWVAENFGPTPTYLDSLMMLGVDPITIAEYESLLQDHYWDGEPFWLYRLQTDDVEMFGHKHLNAGYPVKGVREGPQYRDHSRVAIYKDQYPRKIWRFMGPAENSFPADYNFLSELGNQIAAVTLNAGSLNLWHNTILNDNGDFVNDDGSGDNSYENGQWERVHFMMQDTTPKFSTGIRTRFQYNYPDGSPSDWWPPQWMEDQPGYPDDIPLPWIDPITGELDITTEQIAPEYAIKQAWHQGAYVLDDFAQEAFTAIDTDLEEIFITIPYCRNLDALYYLQPEPITYVQSWLIGTPANGVDTLWRVSPRGCADTLYASFGLFDMAAQGTGEVFWSFQFLTDPNNDIFPDNILLEADTTIAGYDTIYDNQWFYRDEAIAETQIFNGWNYAFQHRQDLDGAWWQSGSFWHDIETGGSNGNKLWEHPQKQFVLDTAGRWFENLWNVPFNWDSATYNYTLAPYIADWLEGNEDVGYMIDYYPEGTRQKPVNLNTNTDWWGARLQAVDYSVPQPFPTGGRQHLWNYNNTEYIDRFEGYSWMNPLDAYNFPTMQYHPNPFDEGIEIPNLPPNNSGDWSLSFKLPTAYDWVYTYAPNGLLYEAGTWSECVSENDTTYCINYFNGDNNYYDEYGIATYQDLTDIVNYAYEDSGVLDDYQAFDNYTARRNRHGQMQNPLNGYLDLDAVADKYFEDYPESNHLEFAWWNDMAPTGTSNTNPGNVLNSRKSFWRRKYHRYGDDIVNDEIEYFLTLLTDQFVAQNGEGFSDELTQILASFLGEEGLQVGSPVWNWLMTAPVNPNGYVSFGQYVLPGTGFYARNSSGSPVDLTITADMGIYDFEWPLTTGNEVYLGSTGPGTDGAGYGGRASLPPDDDDPWIDVDDQNENEEGADHSTITVIDWVNDSTFMPWIFLHHRFMDDAGNGSEQLFEDSQALLPNFPYVFTDSSAVRPSNYVEEYGPHNQAPLYVNIPQPLDSNGAWCFVPTQFQDTGSVWYDPTIGQLYTRIGLELFDDNGQITNIYYLDKGDTLWIRHNDPYEWPIQGKMYFTNLYGDFNGDGLISVFDLITLFTMYGTCAEENPEIAYFDVNGDECITIADFVWVVMNFGATVGSEIGEFSGSIFGDTGGRHSQNFKNHPDWPTAELETFFTGTLPSIYESGNISADKVLTMYGETIMLYDSGLELLAEKTNTMQLPTTGGPYMIVTDRTIAHYDVNEVPNVIEVTTGDPVISDADGGRTAVLPSLASTYTTGSAQFWIDFYNDMKTMDDAYDGDVKDSPTLAQIYYGINSGVNANQTSYQNAKIEGLIDMFGAGSTDRGYTEPRAGGISFDDRFNATATAYTTFKVNRNDPIFEPEFIPMAFALPRTVTKYQERELKGFETQAYLDRKFEDGTVENFDYFGELSGKREVGVAEWGGDIKEYYDVPLHNGMLAMCDFMTLKDYFEFKMYGVSPKFGQTNSGSAVPRSSTESFGSVYNTGAAEGIPNGPGVGFAPSRCNNLTDYTDQIVAPFINANIGNVVVLPQDPTPITQDGIQRNIDNAGHYNWFGNSAAFTHNSSFGPLVYDFNMSGTWDAEDLTIWNGLVAKWQADGIHESNHAYEPASYYRPVTDALNEVVNVIQDYEPGGSYDASWLFNAWFDAEATATPLSYVNNWWKCLNQPAWNLNLAGQAEVPTVAFGGTGTQEDAFFYNATRTGFNPDLLSPPVLNNYGKVALDDIITPGDAAGYQYVPSLNYFPVSKYWHP